MKYKGKIEKRKLDPQEPQAFWKSVQRAAIEHEFKGVFRNIRYLTIRLLDYVRHLEARFLPFNSWRIKCHRKRGVVIGKNVFIGPEVFIDETFPYYVTLEDEVTISPRVFINAHSKPNKGQEKNIESFVSPLVIGEKTFLGPNVVILPTVESIGRGCIIAAGSVVTKNVPDNVMAAGSPAKVVKEL